MSFESRDYKEFVFIARLALKHASTVVDLYLNNRYVDALDVLKAYRECLAVNGGSSYKIEEHLPNVIAKGFDKAKKKFESAIENPTKERLSTASRYIKTPLDQLISLDNALKSD